MNVNKCIKESFTVIGKEGSTRDGEGFIRRLWEDANSHFAEVQHLAKKDENGGLAGIWGPIFPAPFGPGRRGLPKGCIWPGWNAMMRHRPRRAGRNGWFRASNMPM